jgi:AcrR family transcriptional regulator
VPDPNTPGSVTTRGYRSGLRQAMAAQTRQTVLSTAGELFRERGWSGTSMRHIAREAGVAVETVYSTAGSKRELLMQVLDVAVVGDDAAVPLADRPEFAALGRGDRRTRVNASARLLVGLNARTAGLNRALAQAAVADRGLAAALESSRRRQLATYREALALVLGVRPQRQLVEGVWAVGHSDTYLHLVVDAGWSLRRYERWLADTFFRLLVHLPEETT